MEYQPVVIGLVIAVLLYLVLSNVQQTKNNDKKAFSSSTKAALFFFILMISLVISHLGWSFFTGHTTITGGDAVTASEGALPSPDFCIGSLSEPIDIGVAPF